jgi:SagB-type dehydrogenase family enzyme
MDTRLFRVMLSILIIVLICPALVLAQDLKPIKLLPPQTNAGRPLMQALKERKSAREFSDKELPLQVLSNLLWAAFGINRPDLGKRTAPSALNWQEIDVYVATAHGLYLYDAKAQALRPILAQDIRPLTGRQSFVQKAPINLVYVADFARMGTATPEDKALYSAADTGFIGQNVYLYCASEGLATVVRGSIDRPALEKAMRLRSEQKVILAQTVGYPEK